MRTLFLFLLLTLPALLVAPVPAPAQVLQGRYDRTLKNMLDAVQANSYDQFMAGADGKFKAGFTPTMFESLSRQLGPKLQQGYAVTFLTTLNQQDYVVYAWKLVLKDVQDDYLLTLFTRNGNVSGFVAR